MDMTLREGGRSSGEEDTTVVARERRSMGSGSMESGALLLLLVLGDEEEVVPVRASMMGAVAAVMGSTVEVVEVRLEEECSALGCSGCDEADVVVVEEDWRVWATMAGGDCEAGDVESARRLKAMKVVVRAEEDVVVRAEEDVVVVVVVAGEAWRGRARARRRPPMAAGRSAGVIGRRLF
jgi:hypothetical protein